MNNLTVIIPIHQYDENIKTMLERAVATIETDTKVLISTTDEVKASIDEIGLNCPNIEIEYKTSENSSFCALVNQGVETIDTKWFSILEFDDEYSKIWFDEVRKYTEYKPDVSVFLPMTDLIDDTNNKFLGYGNEAVWASSFSNELGYVDNDCLQHYFDFYLTGSIFSTEDWKEYGGLKNSIKLTFWYEYMLRMTYNNKKVFVIPRIGYKHRLNRDGSLIKTYSETISEKESNWWVELAKQEQFFKQDRNKTYQENNEED